MGRHATNTRAGSAVKLHLMTNGTERVPVPAPSDAELVARACEGDATAFESLVRRHYGAAFAVALALMENRADAEDEIEQLAFQVPQRRIDGSDRH